ncbi:glycosyltransferase [Priestia megaterium]|uniref:Glycosyl transferases group 1 family protein n=1 Tax=Priestia megaterium (strain ATCC 14581 / DSM 32 / CCUG 1817 / JCM 2506 / NBRC 15308 / NCIMB 9376 / NCTC 10342 / NRRL B-14308 / VKM B-512 / Ford 19) TaxID=1348623 RepID=A0A0B6ASB5_PRIM2|nr:glycosyltransferase [Priestia megaterium]AJI22744.1 glycosyl transferases group 1 family protein [Priestia megaterium NBRC 15308 = ATCC 14581]KFN06665.1 glycosyl transferases group 1 family protein [Priestia megaterium]KGJ85108.1 glycosyl transferase family 1 [Priestia megaterium NBRC 15308 = ATCC 14581]MDR4233511.1 glycosyltransferase family 4 protein [Priestia megaterium]MED3806986.1 glycosyltransferase [Priestia megaterium]
MKVLLISNMYPSREFPSYGVFVQNTEQILLNNQFQVDRIVLQKKKTKLQKLFGYALHYTKIIWSGLTKKYDYIYVHYAAHNAAPLLLLKKLNSRVTIITNVHGSDVVPEVSSQEKFQPRVKQLLKESAKIITPSPYYMSLVKEKYEVKTPIYIFPSGGVNPDVFYPFLDRNEAFEMLKLDPNQKYIGCVSRIDVGKGWEYYLKAIAHLEEATPTFYKYLYIGSGKDEDAFHNLAEELGIKEKIIHFPLLPQTSLKYVYNAIDAFIFPTVREGESLGLVGLEAMACGTPVIGSKIGGLKDYIIEGKNGLFFQPGNEIELAEKLWFFMSSSEEYKQRLSRQAILTAHDYTINVISEKLPRIFND